MYIFLILNRPPNDKYLADGDYNFTFRNWTDLFRGKKKTFLSSVLCCSTLEQSPVSRGVKESHFLLSTDIVRFPYVNKPPLRQLRLDREGRSRRRMVRREIYAAEPVDEMSARVFNPFPLFEMRGTMRGAGVEGLGGSDRRSRVRVNLFGTVDHEELKRTLENELAEQERRDMEKYNFHFRSMRPMEGGRYDWELVSAAPAPYELRGMPYIHTHTAAEGERATAEGSSTASGPSTAEGAVESRTAAAKGAEGATAPAAPTNVAAFKQSRITDYHQKRKRILAQGKATAPAQASPAAADPGTTIFKKARVQKS